MTRFLLVLALIFSVPANAQTIGGGGPPSTYTDLPEGSARRIANFDPLEVMAAPPTITAGVNNAVSTITGAPNGTMSVQPNAAEITHAGSAAATLSGGYSFGSGGIRTYRKRFGYIGKKFEFRYQGSIRPAFSVSVDGRLVSSGWTSGLVADGTGNQLIAIDFGANTETILATNAAVTAGGSGYAVNDIVTLTGGTGTAATLRVAAISSGAITSVRVETQGSYSVAPTNPVAQGSTTGSGTGATFTLTRGYAETTAKPHLIEIQMGRDTKFGGLNIGTGESVVAWPVPPLAPRRTWIGDSFTDSTYVDTPAGIFAQQAGKLIGDSDDWLYGISGMGYATPGNLLSSYRSFILPQLKDRAVIVLGGNDVGLTPATITANVTAELNAYLASQPQLIITVIAGWSCTATEGAAIQAGVSAASDQSRVRYVAGYPAYTTSTYMRGTDVHPAQNGHNWLARAVVPLVVVAEASMLAGRH